MAIRRSRIVIASALMMAVLVWTGLAREVPVVAAQEATPVASPEPTIEEPVVEEPTGPIQVTVGFYLMSIYSLDQEAGTFYADFYLWMRWQGEADPSLTVEMLNNIERWGLMMTPIYEEPVELPSGEMLQQFHVQGQFVQPLLMKDFPLDEHGLSIQLEDSTYLGDQLVYLADREQSGINPDLRIPGWKVTGWSLTTLPHRYATGFGETGISEQEYSAVRFTLTIERPPSFFRWKLFLPLVIVLLLGCSVLLVHPTYTEVRLAGPATALLTLVFLQQSYTSSLPDNGSLVLLDKIYALAYALVIGLIVTTIVTSHWVREDETNTARTVRLDRIAAFGLFGMFAVGTVVLLLPVV